MAVDKAVDSAQLNADLTSLADAIRTKGGTSAPLAFPSGFAAAVSALPAGADLSGIAGLISPGLTPGENQIYSALSDLLSDANTASGESDTDLSSAVQSLIDGYGGGGSSFDYDVIEYAVTTDSSYNGTTYTIPHGLSYTPTWFVAVQTPQTAVTNSRGVVWCVTSNGAGLGYQSSGAQFNLYAQHSQTTSDDSTNTVGYCDEENFYLLTKQLVFSNVTAGSTIYIITKNTGV